MSDQPSLWVCRGEAADYLRVHPETISRWAQRYQWKTVFDPAGRVRFLRSEVEAALKETRPSPGKTRSYFRKRAMALGA